MHHRSSKTSTMRNCSDMSSTADDPKKCGTCGAYFVGPFYVRINGILVHLDIESRCLWCYPDCMKALDVRPGDNSAPDPYVPAAEQP